MSPEIVPDVEEKVSVRGEPIVDVREICTSYLDAPATWFHPKDIARACEPVTRKAPGVDTRSTGVVPETTGDQGLAATPAPSTTRTRAWYRVPGSGALSPVIDPDVEEKVSVRGEPIVAVREICTWYRGAPPTPFQAKDIARS